MKKKEFRVWLIILYFLFNIEIGGTLAIMSPSIIRNLEWAMMFIHIGMIALWLYFGVYCPFRWYVKRKSE